MSNTGGHNVLFKAIILALCVISFVHIFLFPLYGINNNNPLTQTFQDFEQSLCINVIRRQKIMKKSKCPQYGIVTILQGGRLGNQMWEYASIWALARRTGLEPYIPRCIKSKLSQVFTSLSLSTFEEIAHCPVDIKKFVKSLDEWIFINQSIILPKYSLQPELVITWVQDIIQEFSIKKKLLDKSQQVLHLAAKNANTSNPVTYVGVHVRRTDYLGHLRKKFGAEPANVSFYLSAMNCFKKKYSNVIFVVVSDDPRWCSQHFIGKKNIYVKRTGRNQRDSAALDLAILSSCNHSIFDYGTFGEWGAILAGGETIYYNLSRHSTARLGELLPDWHTL